MWRIIKYLFWLCVIAVVALAVTGYKIKGKTIQEHAEPFLNSSSVKEGIHDMRSIVGEGLKAAGEAISEDVTDSERKGLEDVLKKELTQGKPIEGTAGQDALAPDFKAVKPLDDKPQAIRPADEKAKAAQPVK